MYRKNAGVQNQPKTRTHTLRKPAQSTSISTCHKSHLIRKFTGKMPRPRISPEHRHTLFASLRPAQSKCTSTFHKSHIIQEFTRKMPASRTSPEREHTLCASLRSRNALQHVTRATLYGNLQEKCRGPRTQRACSVEMHFNISQEPLYTETYRKNAGAQSEHPDQAPAFALTVRTSQCGHTGVGNTSLQQDIDLGQPTNPNAIT